MKNRPKLYSLKDAAKEAGISYDRFHYLAEKLRLGQKVGQNVILFEEEVEEAIRFDRSYTFNPFTDTTREPVHVPPHEIAAECAKIQAEWDDKERHDRTVIHNPPVELDETFFMPRP